MSDVYEFEHLVTGRRALTDLEQVLYEYARTLMFRDLMAGGAVSGKFDDAFDSLMVSHPEWYGTMTALFDVELCLDRCLQTAELLESHRDPDPLRDGALVVYHLDAFALHAHALCEKSINLFTNAYRNILSRYSSLWSATLAERKAAARAGNALTKMRTGVAHPVHFTAANLETGHGWMGHALLDSTITKGRERLYQHMAGVRPQAVETCKIVIDDVIKSLGVEWSALATELVDAKDIAIAENRARLTEMLSQQVSLGSDN